MACSPLGNEYIQFLVLLLTRMVPVNLMTILLAVIVSAPLFTCVHVCGIVPYTRVLFIQGEDEAVTEVWLDAH